MSSRMMGNGGRRGKQIPVGKRPVSEAIRIGINQRLEEFRHGNLQEMTFEKGLSNHDRAVVHNFCLRMGFKSRSYGKGEDRCVTVFKNHEKSSNPRSPAVVPLTFTPETKQVLEQLYASFPPCEDEAALTSSIYNPAGDFDQYTHAETPSCMFLNPSEVAEELENLQKRRESNKKIVDAANRLPIAKYRDLISSTVHKNQVVIIAGETGCGKSTQVPQYILEHMWSQGKGCRIYCTQPRRISATSVSDRVATELGENLGETVGYQIRLEGQGGPHSSVMFCTNGLLLQKMVTSLKSSEDGLLATHVIVDEIHERDCNADFLLIILKDMLASRPDLRLILMSATLDSQVFSTYFNNCPVLKIPGFTHPVRVHHLEDVLAFAKYEKAEPVYDTEERAELDKALSDAWLDEDFDSLLSHISSDNTAPEVFNYRHSTTGATPLMVTAGKGRIDDVSLLLSLGADYSIKCEDGETALDWAVKYNQEEAAAMIRDYTKNKQTPEEAELLGRYERDANHEQVDVGLIECLLQKICQIPESSGAMLVFLPGWDDITRCRDRLLKSPFFSDPTKFVILPLHSMVPMPDQKKVFRVPPPGARKIVLATNIAETSITIDDVVYVVDSGRAKEKSYDPYTNVSTFQTMWISKANARQREGRAGRCQPGVCYHLFSKIRAAALADFQVPEMNRTPLEEICLKVKLLEPNGNIQAFLSKALDPPNELSIKNAVALLQDIGALNLSEELTELGKHLGSLPLHPSTSKMLLLGVLLNCLDPALTIAAATQYRDPFISPLFTDQKQRAVAIKRQFGAIYGGYSDHLAVVGAFEGWRAAKKRGAGAGERYCTEKFLASGTMHMLDRMRNQLLNELVKKGFATRDPQACSLNANDPGILRAILATSLYPMVGKLRAPVTPTQRITVEVPRGEKVRFHPSSANCKLIHTDRSKVADVCKKHLVVFSEIIRGEGPLSIRDSTVVKPHLLFFLSNEVAVAPLEQSDSDEEADLMDSPERKISVVIDRWLQYATTSGEAAQIYCLRERLLGALQFKVLHPRQNLPDMLAASVYALACILSYEGGLEVDASTVNVVQPTVQPSSSGGNIRNANGYHGNGPTNNYGNRPTNNYGANNSRSSGYQPRSGTSGGRSNGYYGTSGGRGNKTVWAPAKSQPRSSSGSQQGSTSSRGSSGYKDPLST